MLTNLIVRKSPWWTGLHKFNLPSFCGLVATELSGRFSVFKIQHHVCATKRQALTNMKHLWWITSWTGYKAGKVAGEL